MRPLTSLIHPPIGQVAEDIITLSFTYTWSSSYPCCIPLNHLLEIQDCQHLEYITPHTTHLRKEKPGLNPLPSQRGDLDQLLKL